MFVHVLSLCLFVLLAVCYGLLTIVILVGGIPTPLKNLKSVGIIVANIWKIIKFMFQTTNQNMVFPYVSTVQPQPTVPPTGIPDASGAMDRKAERSCTRPSSETANSTSEMRPGEGDPWVSGDMHIYI